MAKKATPHKIDNPALATLIDSVNLEKAKEELAEAMDIIVRKADNEVKTELLSILVALTQDERLWLSKIVETNIERKGFFLDTPFIKRIRGESREEGIEIGAERRFYEIAKNMRQKGMSVEEISELTGLSIGISSLYRNNLLGCFTQTTEKQHHIINL